MGGEGHMLDMIKRMELNRQQRKDSGKRFSKHRKPSISTETLKNIEEIDYPPKEKKLTAKQKKMYQVLAIATFIFIVVVLSIIIFYYLTTPMSFLYGR